MSLLSLIKRYFGIEAASGSPRHGSNMLPAAASQTHAAANIAAARARSYAINSPIGSSIILNFVDALLPEGPAVQFKTGNDVPAENFFYKILPEMRLLVRSQFVNGEGVARLRTDRNAQLKLQVLNPEQLDRSINRDLANGGRIIAGVEMDAHDEIVAYWILPDAPDQAFATIAPAQRFLKDDIIHVFEKKFPGQFRGISELTPVITRVAEAHKLSDNRLARAGTAALWGAFISDASGTAFGDAIARPLEADISLEPGAMRILPVGTQITFPNMPDDGNAGELMKAMLHEICAGVGMPYTLITGDLQETSYSSGKLGMESFKRRVKAIRASMLVPQVFEPLHRRFSLLRALNGLPASFDEASYLLPDFASLEPKKEAEADVILLNASALTSKCCTVSPRAWMASSR